MEESDRIFWDAIDNVKEDDLLKEEENGVALTLQKATELSVWLHTEYQCKMEEADTLMATPAKDETKPFDEKYKAREILQNLRQSPYLGDKYTRMPASEPSVDASQQQDENVENSEGNQTVASEKKESSDVMRCALGLVMHKLGVNFYDCEEPQDGLVCLRKSFDLLDSLPDQLKLRHLNTVQDLYISIATILSDRDKTDEALSYLEKAQEIYLMVEEHTKDLPQVTVVNNFDLFLLKQGSAQKKADEKFSFYINAGLDLKQLHQKYTTTLFILAQVHSKLNHVEEGMKYCAITMKRQLTAQEYEVKDWVVNAMSLGDAYLAKEHFAQAEYMLYAALHVLPADAKQHDELRAQVQMQIGRYYQRRLEVGVRMMIEGLVFDKSKVEEKFVEFAELQMQWPSITDITNMEDAKRMFRLANTMFKKALEQFILDGYVTEHVVIQQGISQLYKLLTRVETDPSRNQMMHERRISSLEFLKGALNPNAYQVRMMEFSAELADVYGDLYEIETHKAKKSMEAINKVASKCIENVDTFANLVYSKEDPDDKFEYLATMLNLELSAGSKETKWLTSDGRERIEKTKAALDRYKRLHAYVKGYFKFKGIQSAKEIENSQVQQQIGIVEEIVELLPAKLDKMAAALR